jgi:hypothetical protein
VIVVRAQVDRQVAGKIWNNKSGREKQQDGLHQDNEKPNEMPVRDRTKNEHTKLGLEAETV